MFSQLSPLLPAWQSPCCEVLKSRLRGGICSVEAGVRAPPGGCPMEGWDTAHEVWESWQNPLSPFAAQGDDVGASWAHL